MYMTDMEKFEWLRKELDARKPMTLSNGQDCSDPSAIAEREVLAKLYGDRYRQYVEAVLDNTPLLDEDDPW